MEDDDANDVEDRELSKDFVSDFSFGGGGNAFGDNKASRKTMLQEIIARSKEAKQVSSHLNLNILTQSQSAFSNSNEILDQGWKMISKRKKLNVPQFFVFIIIIKFAMINNDQYLKYAK